MEASLVLHVHPGAGSAAFGRGSDCLTSVAAARDAIRQRQAAWGRRPRPVTVLIHGGRDVLTEPLRFGPEDSGAIDCPIRYVAAPGTTPIISGGRRIEHWRLGTAHGLACWIADLPEVKSGAWNFTQLFVNGQRRHRPRLPKAGFFHFADRRPADFPGGLVRYGNGPTHAYYRPGDLRRFHNLTDVKLLTYTAWYETHHRLQAVDEGEQRVDFQSRGFSGGYTGADSRYVVENVFEALDSPGQWYLDRPAGTLYYLPRAGEDPILTEVVAPRLDTLVHLAGTADAPVQHLHFERLAFAHSQWDYAPDFAGSLQAADLVPGAIVLDWAEHCVFYDCHVAHVAQYAIDLRRGSHANAVVGCVLEDLGGGGVRVGNEELPAVAGVYDALPAAQVKPAAATIADCTIRDGGRLFPSAVGVWIGNAGWNNVLHNHIYNFSYTAISCGWIWGYAPSRTIGNRIEGNHVHHIAWDRLLHDLGGIYTLGVQPGGRIRRNYVHHIGGNGIYLDEGSSEFLVEGNLVHHVDTGFTLHYGRDNEVRCNIFSGSAIAHLLPGAMEAHRSMVYHHNVVTWSDGSKLGENPWGASVQWWKQYNLCYNLLLWDGQSASTTERMPDGVCLSHWQAQGQFHDTTVADPLFRDPASGDFSCSADSPLLALGITALPVAETGPRLRGRRPDSFSCWQAAFGIPLEPMARSLLESPEPGLLRLTIRNLGPLAISGSGRLRVAPESALIIDEAASWDDIRLEPGGQCTRQWRFTADRAAPRRVTVVAEFSGDGLMATALHLLTQPQDWTLPQLSALANATDVPSALATTNAKPLRHPLFGVEAGEVRVARAGTALAIDVRVIDHHLRAGALAWQGSCLELFAAPLGVKGVNPTQPAKGIVQILLVPAIAAAPARALIMAGGEKPAPDIALACDPLVDGYRLLALIPLNLLGVSGLEAFTLQMVVTTTPEKNGRSVRVPLFHYDAGAFASAMHHGLVR